MHSISFNIEEIVSAAVPILSRDTLATGGAAQLARRDQPLARLLTDAEQRRSLSTFMSQRPAGDLWVFGYGSLIWNPALRSAERRVARVNDWHRSFSLSMPVGRGTPNQPGLALGLERGGICYGVADRIVEKDIVSELSLLWSREMLLGGYSPRWVNVLDADGRKFGSAITFAIDPEHEQYAGNLSQHEIVRRLATAAGSWGSSADYLFRTIQGLRRHGIPDAEMERLGELVSAVMRDQDMDQAA